MSSVVELLYNPYIPKLSIIIDGKQPPDFSRLIQYVDEDIWKWYRDILDAIYLEIRNEFVLLFIGTPQDAAIMEYVCKQYKFCKEYNTKKFLISDSLQMRMQKLNQYLKKVKDINVPKMIVPVSFVMSVQTRRHIEDIQSIDVNNQFCSVRVNAVDLSANCEAVENSFLFFVVDSCEMEQLRINHFHAKLPYFVIVIGDKNCLIKVEDNACFVETTREELFPTIFECLLYVPLLEVFRKIIHSLARKINDIELDKIYAIEPSVNINVENEIEVGKSAKITVSLEPMLGEIPELIYRMTNQNIASCNGMYVLGKQEGIANLEIYRSGDKKPFLIKKIKIYKRNRITKIILSEDVLVLGVGTEKQIGCDYVPQNADNTETLEWSSSNERVASITNDGRISAVGIGECRIICLAENISAQCKCIVKPYLKEICVEPDAEILYLEPLEELTLQVVTKPDNCIDDQILIQSSDINVVNIVQNRIYAKNKGKAIITVKNSSGRISQNIEVIVEKKGFFKKIRKNGGKVSHG